jgi:hypothetical protein
VTPGYHDDNPQRGFPGPGPAGTENGTQPHDDPEPEYNVWAIISVCCGILGLVMLQVILAPAAIVLGALGVHSAKRIPSTQRLAVAGYVLGILDGLVWLLVASVFHIASFPL